MNFKKVYIAVVTANLLACGGSNAATNSVVEVGQVTGITQPQAYLNASAENLFLYQNITLDASSSTDAQSELTFSWHIVDSQGGIVERVEAVDSVIQYRPTTAGNFSGVVTVTDSAGNSDTAKVDFVVQPEAVIVSALGDGFEAKKGDSVTLSAREAVSKVGVIEQATWSVVGEARQSKGNQTNVSGFEPAFTFDEVGSYQVALALTDEHHNVVTDTVTVKISDRTQNASPSAAIYGLRNQVKVNEMLLLDGSASYDPDVTDLLIYEWKVIEKPNRSFVRLSSPFDEQVAVSATLAGEYTIALEVKDLAGLSDTALYHFTVSDADQPPIAILGADITANLGETVHLSCEACIDHEQSLLSGKWKLTIRPSGSKADIDGQAQLQGASFTADRAGLYGIRVAVSDGLSESWSNTQFININSNVDSKPSAVIAPISDITLGQSVLLDATQSGDPEGLPLTYNWRIVKQPGTDSLSTPQEPKLSYTPTAEGSYQVELSTFDGALYSNVASVTFNVTNNQSPVIEVVEPLETEVQLGQLVSIDASNSYDPEGQALSYSWKLINSNNEVVIANAAMSSFSFTADLAGVYKVELSIFDTDGASATRTFEFTALDLPQTLHGSVSGRLVNSQLNGIGNVTLKVNGESVATDNQGHFYADVQLTRGEKVTIQTADQKVLAASYQSASQLNNDFKLSLGNAFVPMMQPVRQHVWTCFSYRGKNQVDVQYELVNTLPTTSPFVFDYNETMSIPLNRRQEIQLPATATYKITPVDSSTYYVSSSSNRIEVSLLEGYQQPIVYNICNYK
ncbi:PKD domain-containing protein [Pseudoalteromonas sp. S2755]|uniref:PKD domain-containing protein n=1 Tax=Pseudoalteromonas sp. S2755 TaxID=2066523 RepID=UPI00110B6619|nr:PKD domain-containing protein [Pseudoalteromonas sp. S2755]TMN35352.1 PKD domain-containing protein [Pseudoalteromonas sp. S2755]